MAQAKGSGKPRVEAEAKLEWVHVSLIRVSPLAQRDENLEWVRKLAEEMDLEQLGFITVNHRDGVVYCIDGQHRVEALRQHGYGDQMVQCRAYTGLTEAQEAEMFLRLNDQLSVSAYSKFRVAVTAGRTDEVNINNIVRHCGLKVSKGKSDSAITAVGTLRRMYARGGASNLARSLVIIRDAFGGPGLESAVMDGISLLVHRYGDDLDDVKTVKALAATMGGVHGLLAKAEQLRLATHNAKGQCVAAAAVEIIKKGKNNRKLANWWGEDQPAASNGRSQTVSASA